MGPTRQESGRRKRRVRGSSPERLSSSSQDQVRSPGTTRPGSPSGGCAGNGLAYSYREVQRGEVELGRRAEFGMTDHLRGILRPELDLYSACTEIIQGRAFPRCDACRDVPQQRGWASGRRLFTEFVPGRVFPRDARLPRSATAEMLGDNAAGRWSVPTHSSRQGMQRSTSRVNDLRLGLCLPYGQVVTTRCISPPKI